MTHAQVPTQIDVPGQGEHTTSPKDPSFTHDKGTIVHRRFDKKDILQQLWAGLGIQLGTAAQDLIQGVFTLKHDEGAGAALAHVAAGFHGHSDGMLDITQLLFLIKDL